MAKSINNNSKRLQRKRRIRAKISGTAQRPRLAVFKSLTAISAQVIDDAKGATLCSAQLKDVKGGKNTIEGAKMIGKLVAEKCKGLKIDSVVFDRAGYQYHGKIKALAEAAREAGLEF